MRPFLISLSMVIFCLSLSPKAYAQMSCVDGDDACQKALLDRNYEAAKKKLADDDDATDEKLDIKDASKVPLTGDWHIVRKVVGRPEMVSRGNETHRECLYGAAIANKETEGRREEFYCKQF